MTAAQVHKLLDVVRVLREQSLSEAIDMVSQGVETISGRMGTNVHPDLGRLWLEYGDLLLQQTEEALLTVSNKAIEMIGVSSSVDASQSGTASSSTDCAPVGAVIRSADSVQVGMATSTVGLVQMANSSNDVTQVAVVDKDDQELANDLGEAGRSLSIRHEALEENSDGHSDGQSEEGDDLLLAYECLEVARRCYGLHTKMLPTILRERAMLHRRLSDFKALQMHTEDAVMDSRESLTLYRQAAINDGTVVECQDVASRVRVELKCSEIREAIGHLITIAERAKLPMKSVLGDGADEQLLWREFSESLQDPSPVSISDRMGASQEIRTVAVRPRKRKHEEDNE